MIKPIAVYSYDRDSIDIKEDQLVYCIDTKEAYYDISNLNRIQLNCTIQLDEEYDKDSIVNKKTNKIYIVKRTNKLYRYINNGFEKINDRLSVIDILVPAEELVPTTLNKKGINYAPKTLASMVYTNDGNTVEDVLRNIVDTDDKKVLLYTRTEHVVATTFGQRIFTIPFPIPNYDLAKFPMLIIYKDRILSGSQYSISNDQVILSNNINGLDKDEILTFVFHYNVVISNEGINAESINNVRFYVGEKEPYPKRETDVWFDTKKQEVKQYSAKGKWEIIVKNREEFPFSVLKNTTILNSSSTYVEIGIPGFDKTKDILMVYNNSIYIEENQEYTISADGNYIIRTHGNTWNGDLETNVFNFIVFKSSNPTNKTQIVKRSISVNYSTTEVPLPNDYDMYSDSIFVYENSVYLEQNEDYEMSPDGTKIINKGDTWRGDIDKLTFNFVIIKNSTVSEEMPVIENSILKNQIFKILDVTEEEFEQIKNSIL